MTPTQKTLLLAGLIALWGLSLVGIRSDGYVDGYASGYSDCLKTIQEPGPAWDEQTFDKAVQDEIERQRSLPPR